MEIKKVLITKEGRTFYVKDLNQDYHTPYGFIKKADLKKNGRVLSNTKREFYIIEPSFIDLYKKLKRGAQIMIPKDIVAIIAETGINNKSAIVDAGGGSGALACFLANIVKQVTSYEIRKEFVKIIKENREALGLKNLIIKNKDVYKGIDEKNIDLITLDLPEPWKAVRHAEKSLKPGGFLVAYNMHLSQVKKFVEEIKKNNFVYLKTKEIIEREWEIDEQRLRPKNIAIGHTGFLSFARKLT